MMPLMFPVYHCLNLFRFWQLVGFVDILLKLIVCAFYDLILSVFSNVNPMKVKNRIRIEFIQTQGIYFRPIERVRITLQFNRIPYGILVLCPVRIIDGRGVLCCVQEGFKLSN